MSGRAKQREEIGAGSQQTLIFILSIVFVFFLLAAQYESYILPFAVILSVQQVFLVCLHLFS